MRQTRFPCVLSGFLIKSDPRPALAKTRALKREETHVVYRNICICGEIFNVKELGKQCTACYTLHMTQEQRRTQLMQTLHLCGDIEVLLEKVKEQAKVEYQTNGLVSYASSALSYATDAEHKIGVLKRLLEPAKPPLIPDRKPRLISRD